MTAVAFAVLALTIALDVIGQLCFKFGLDQREEPDLPVWRKVLTTPLIWAGVAAYAVELGAWLFVLSRLPLSVAFPLVSLSYCGIALAGRCLLHEHVSRQRWIGTFLIALGAAIVSTTT